MKNETTASLQIVEVEGVRGYVDALGTVWLNAEDVARGLGFVQVKKDRVPTNGDNSPASGDNVSISCDNPYTAVRWERVNSYLNDYDLNLLQKVGRIPKKIGKGDFIPEQIVYLLAMKANNEVAKAFQMKIAIDILPSIRQTGSYSLNAAPAPAVKPAAKKIDLARVYLLLLSDGTVQIVKIGQSKNIRSRVAKIERETGLTVVDMYFTPDLPREIARLVEWASQKVLSSQRVKGEFFSVEFKKARATIKRFMKLAVAELPSGYNFDRDENIFAIADK